MKKVIETIKVKDGEIWNLSYHQNRFEKTQKELFNVKTPIQLSTILKPRMNDGIFRCRIVYDKEIKSIEYLPYNEREVNSIKVCQSSIDYSYKYENRDEINRLLALAKNYDEIIIEKDGYLTDTSIANIAFYDGKKWLTPKTPLLNGTTRERLIKSNFLTIANIKRSDIKNFTHVALMNAMIEFKILNINPADIR